jgi:hypothetical protein
MKTLNKQIAGFFTLMILVLASCAPEDTGDGSGRGCMDPAAVNYSSQSIEDDGSCVTIEQKQNGLFLKYTATWCQPCGEWGMDAFNGVYQANKGKVLAFTVQTNDDLMTPRNEPTFTAFSSRWNYGGTPNFVVNNTLINTNYGQAAGEIATLTAQSPTVGTNLKWTIGAGTNDGKINVNAYAKFYAQSAGEYKMGVYIIAKKLVAYQNGQGADYEHHNVLVGFAGTDAWGETITTTGAKADQVFHLSYVLPLEANWNVTDLDVETVIWKKNGTGSWDFVNASTN